MRDYVHIDACVSMKTYVHVQQLPSPLHFTNAGSKSPRAKSDGFFLHLPAPRHPARARHNGGPDASCDRMRRCAACQATRSAMHCPPAAPKATLHATCCNCCSGALWRNTAFLNTTPHSCARCTHSRCAHAARFAHALHRT